MLCFFNIKWLLDTFTLTDQQQKVPDYSAERYNHIHNLSHITEKHMESVHAKLNLRKYGRHHTSSSKPLHGPRFLLNTFSGDSMPNLQMVVPKRVHYVWFHSRRKCHFKFFQFMSVVSAYRYIMPNEIWIWYDNLPCGDWWEETKARVPVLILQHLAPPVSVYGNPIMRIEHKTDVARLEILLKYGGIYLDSDMVALRSWEPLLYYSTTLGIQTQRDLGNAVIISMKNATFINLWMSSYQHFKGKEFGFNSCIVPLVLAKRYPKLIHLEANTLYRPNSHMTEWIYGKGKLWDWSGSYGMHLYYRLYKKDHTLEDMKTLNTTIGQLFRLIYFNNTAIIH